MQNTHIVLAAIMLCRACHTSLAGTGVFNRYLTCGTFKAEARTTLVAPVEPLVEQAREQTILITAPTAGVPVFLDLRQHSSPDPDLHGQRVLDGFAWAWQCVRGSANTPYLQIYFTCHNPAAKTCSIAMDVPGSEWTQFYDGSGHAVLPDPHGLTKNDIARIKRLGVYDKFFGAFSLADRDMLYDLPLQLSP